MRYVLQRKRSDTFKIEKVKFMLEREKRDNIDKFTGSFKFKKKL